MFFFICVWIDGWENNREAGDLRRYRTHYDVIVNQQQVTMILLQNRVQLNRLHVVCVYIVYKDYQGGPFTNMN